jgi:hypothetical protein
MSSFNESSGTIGLKSADPSTKHRTALRIFWSLFGTILLLALLPVVPAAAAGSAAAVRPHVAGSGAAYTPVTPKRLMDTRTSGGHLGAGASRNLTVTGGTTGVPATATSVVLNVTATDTTTGSFLTVYPAGSARPLASNLNWVKGKTIPNLVSVPVGTAGAITFFNAKGNVDVVADLEGYFSAPSGNAGGEVALTPARITDTRAGSGQANAGSTLGAAGTLIVQVTGKGGVPAAGVSGVIVNVTVTDTTAASFLTVWPKGVAMPLASNLNWKAGVTIPNRVFVPVGTGGQVSVFNARGSADVIVDVSGYFTDSTASGALFTPLSPFRILDTRGVATLGPGGTQSLQIGGVFGVPAGAKAAMLNVTATDTTRGSFLTVYPSTATRPTASDLNWTAGVTIPNLTVATLGTTGAITFFNAAGSVDVVADIFGYFGATAGVSVSANPSSVPANGTTSLVTATVTNADGSPAIADNVNFALSGAACGSLSGANPTPTSASGKASITYHSSTTVGNCTVTATEATNGLSGTTTIAQTAVKNTIVTTATPNSVLANGSATSAISSTVTNSVSGAVVGDVVSYTVSGSPSAASCGTLSASSATTAGGGITPNVTYTASSTTGFCTVTATEAGTGISTTALITQHGTSTNTTTVVANPTSIAANGTSTSTVTATVAGAGASGDPVGFSLSGGAACGTVSPVTTTANASGVATTTYTSSTTAGTCTVTATEANGGSTNTATITQTAVLNNVALTANPSNVAADGTSTSTLTATVTSGVTSAAVAADSITFTSAGTCGTFTTANPKATDATGVATVTYKASAVIGFCTITATEQATAPGTGNSATTTINQTTAAANSLTLSASKTSVPADGTTSTITAKVRNSSGGGVAADPVNFASSGSPAAACGTLTGSTSPTDATGSATVLYTASTTVGTCTITATEASAGKSGSVTITQTTVLNKVTQTAAPATVLANGTATSTITTTVTHSAAAVVGDAVTYTTSGTCGALSGSTSPTNASGVVTVTYTASSAVGFCTVTGTETGNGSSASTLIVQNNGGANTISVAAVPSSLPADGKTTSTITATVTGTGSAGDQVMFTLTPNVANGCGTLSSATATTNATSKAIVTYTASLGSGVSSCTITAFETNGGSNGTANITQTTVINFLTISASPTTIKGDGVSTSTITAHVTSGITGLPVAGDSVTFAFDNARPPCGSYAGAGVSAPVLTDASGNASTTYTSAVAPGTFCHAFAVEGDTGFANSVATDAVITQTP